MVRRYADLYLDTKRALLSREEPEDAVFLARNLICHYSGKSREALLADGSETVPEAVCQAVEQGVSRLLSGEPLAYVLGQWDFYGMTLKVTPEVLIPRDDTCAVTDLAIGAVKQENRPVRVLDLCTGSGCIGLAIAKEAGNAQVVLADLSPAVLAVAAENAAPFGSRVSWVIADALAQPEPGLGQFDLIVSNPPYITGAEMESLPHSVSGFEPHLALFGGADGLDFYRAISKHYRSILTPGGFLCFEFGMGQGDGVCAILEENGFTVRKRARDGNRIERAVLAQYGRKDDTHGK